MRGVQVALAFDAYPKRSVAGPPDDPFEAELIVRDDRLHDVRSGNAVDKERDAFDLVLDAPHRARPQRLISTWHPVVREIDEDVGVPPGASGNLMPSDRSLGPVH